MKILYFFLFSFLFIACNTPVINKNDVVAEVNGEQILLSELASQSKQEIFDILNTAYEIKSSVETMVFITAPFLGRSPRFLRERSLYSSIMQPS